MPFKAFDTDKKINVIAYWFDDGNTLRAKHPNLVCPCCENRMAARGGKSKRTVTHFYHTAKNDDCLSEKKYRSYKDKDFLTHHTTMVKVILDYLKPQIPPGFSLDTEHISKNVPGRIADIAVLDQGGNIVEAHEVQLTKVTISELKERTDSYEHSGVEVVWWFGKGCDSPDIIQWAQRNFGYCLLPNVSFFTEEIEVEGF